MNMIDIPEYGIIKIPGIVRCAVRVQEVNESTITCQRLTLLDRITVPVECFYPQSDSGTLPLDKQIATYKRESGKLKRQVYDRPPFWAYTEKEGLFRYS